MNNLQFENNKNKKSEISVSQIALVLANVWMTLLAPLLIGVFVSKLFTSQEFSKIEPILYASCIALHIIFTLIIFISGNRISTTSKVDDLIHDNKNFIEHIIPKATALFENAKIQQTVSYLMTLELERIIDEINDRPSNTPLEEKLTAWDEGLNRLLNHLVQYRNELFNYKAKEYYNFALYLYDEKNDELSIKWRSHDNRIITSGRSWKPGFGHVGLTFIHNEIKICHDILSSTELSSSAAEPNDSLKYRSFLSVPIKDSSKLNTGGKPLGVLVFTSNSVNQFSLDRDKMLSLTIAKILSIYVDKIVKS